MGPQRARQDPQSKGPEVSLGWEGSPATQRHPRAPRKSGKQSGRGPTPTISQHGTAPQEQPSPLPSAVKSRSVGDAARAAGTTALVALLALTGVK